MTQYTTIPTYALEIQKFWSFFEKKLKLEMKHHNGIAGLNPDRKKVKKRISLFIIE